MKDREYRCSECLQLQKEEMESPYVCEGCEGKPRYVVDERNGCIAIRDTQHPDYMKSNGLESDMADVIEYELGTSLYFDKKMTWDLDPEIIKKFYKKCDILNRGIK